VRSFYARAPNYYEMGYCIVPPRFYPRIPPFLLAKFDKNYLLLLGLSCLF